MPNSTGQNQQNSDNKISLRKLPNVERVQETIQLDIMWSLGRNLGQKENKSKHILMNLIDNIEPFIHYFNKHIEYM